MSNRNVAKHPMLEVLEARQLMAVSPIVAGTKVSTGNLASGGVATNQSLITIPFSGPINIAAKSGIQLRGYAINPLTGSQKKIVIGVVNATLSKDRKSLAITTDRMMRKGGTISWNATTLKDDKGNFLAAQSVKSIKGQNKERFTLANRGFKPTDLTKFTKATYAGAPDVSPNGTAVPEATARANLKAFLDKKVSLALITGTKRDQMMTRFDSATTKSIVPDPNMRAALLSLVGTLAEGAIASMLDGANPSGKAYTVVDFDVPPDTSVPVAQTVVRSDGRL
ncbi:MAG TPA: hypothetical protein VF669_22235, partial [Tepidisphaeraceae bacterium]